MGLRHIDVSNCCSAWGVRRCGLTVCILRRRPLPRRKVMRRPTAIRSVIYELSPTTIHSRPRAPRLRHPAQRDFHHHQGGPGVPRVPFLFAAVRSAHHWRLLTLDCVPPRHSFISRGNAMESFYNSLNRLGVEYVDMYLVWWPGTFYRLHASSADSRNRSQFDGVILQACTRRCVSRVVSCIHFVSAADSCPTVPTATRRTL